MSPETKKLTLNVAPPMHTRLEEMSERRGITVTELLRRFVIIGEIVDQAQVQSDCACLNLTVDNNDGTITNYGIIPGLL